MKSACMTTRPEDNSLQEKLVSKNLHLIQHELHSEEKLSQITRQLVSQIDGIKQEKVSVS